MIFQTMFYWRGNSEDLLKNTCTDRKSALRDVTNAKGYINTKKDNLD